jgi:hypothetical protein
MTYVVTEPLKITGIAFRLGEMYDSAIMNELTHGARNALYIRD